MFGWIPALWRISEQQVLAAAGLDAYVVCISQGLPSMRMLTIETVLAFL